MTSAREKNAQALTALFGNNALATRLETTRIAVVLPQTPLSVSGRILVTALSDVLARLWQQIDFSGVGAEDALPGARDAALSGGGTGETLLARWDPPYDVVLTIGCDLQQPVANTVRVGANGWMASMGPTAVCGDDGNPVGPAYAAAMASAHVFHRMFATELADIGSPPYSEWTGDLREPFGVPNLGVTELNLGQTHVFGVGAVTHGFVWLLEQWPAKVLGNVALVDRDSYGRTNGQRYAFMRAANAGTLKVNAVKERLLAAHPGLHVTAHPTDLNTYCEERGFDQPLQRVVTGLDSEESRRHAAFKQPDRIINMWTAGERLGAGRYVPKHGGACLACEYLEPTTAQTDEAADMHKQTGLRPDIVRELLDTARGFTHDEAQIVANKWNMQVEMLQGEPLRSVLPILCATGHLTMTSSKEAVDVPFSFSSLFAGIAGFMMLLKDLADDNALSQGWTQHNFKKATGHMLSTRYPRHECVRCTAEAQMTTTLSD